MKYSDKTIPLLSFEDGPGLPLLNFKGPGLLVQLLHHVDLAKMSKRFRKSKCSCLDMKMMLTHSLNFFSQLLHMLH